MNRTCDNDARRTSALTNRRANAPNFSAKTTIFKAFNVNSPTSSQLNHIVHQFISVAEGRGGNGWN